MLFIDYVFLLLIPVYDCIVYYHCDCAAILPSETNKDITYIQTARLSLCTQANSINCSG